MAITDETTTELPQAGAPHSSTAASLVVCLGIGYVDPSPGQLAALLDLLRRALSRSQSAVGPVTLAYPSTQQEVQATEQDGFALTSYTAHGSPQGLSVHPAATWLNQAGVLRSHGARAGLLFGAEAESLVPEAVAGMVDAVLLHGVDLALPFYALAPNQGLLNQAMLAPLSRALFTPGIGFPLALDVAFSLRMADRMAQAAQRVPAAAQADAIVWPVDEAAVAGFDIAEVGDTTRNLPSNPGDLSQILRDVAGSLFADIEAKASFWQRTRPAKEPLRLEAVPAPRTMPPDPAEDEEIDDLLASFRIGYNNLHDIWSLVLPPQTLVSLKRLSQAPRDTFNLPDAECVRIV